MSNAKTIAQGMWVGMHTINNFTWIGRVIRVGHEIKKGENMGIKALTVIMSLLFLSGCANHLESTAPYWRYVEGLPVKRVDTFYVVNVGERKLTYIEVSGDFRYIGKDSLQGLELDVFSDDESGSVMVANRFGIFKEKLVPSIDSEQFLVHELSSPGWNQYYVTTVAEDDHDGSITVHMAHTEKADNGWINSYATYSEPLPDHYPFESWNSSVLEERMEYISEIEKKGKEAVTFYPGDPGVR